MTGFRWKYNPCCPCSDCKDYEREQEPAYKFQKMEDERAEFEATFLPFGCVFVRLKSTQTIFTDARSDYRDPSTANAWFGWLAAARVEWVPTP